MGHIVVEARVYGLLRGGYVGLFQEDVNFVEHEVILDPLEAFARSLELGEVVESAVLRADYGGYHGVCVDDVLVNDCVDPAGGAAIYMRVAQADRARAYAYEGGVAAAAEYGQSPSSPAALSVSPPTRAVESIMSAMCSGLTLNILSISELQPSLPLRTS